MKKLLVICGPTATGKTSLAVNVGKLLGGEIVSADSRQVYKKMDIGTGKDLPEDAKLTFPDKDFAKKGHGYYEMSGVKVWGYDLVDPKRQYSVSQYVRVAKKIINRIWDKEDLPIVTGGTGLYIQGIIDGIETASIPKNKKLRDSLKDRKVDELFDQLAKLDPIKAASMNMSDRKNPRRLIRAIEIAQWKVGGGEKNGKLGEGLEEKSDLLMVGLTADQNYLCENVKKRVKNRVKMGIEAEVKELLDYGVTWEDQSMDTLGYKQWKGYFKGDKDKEKVYKEWEREECGYAKRQMTWFKKDKRINWFDVSKKSYESNVEKLVKRWYNSN